MTVGPYWTGDVPATDLQIAITRNGVAADLNVFTGVTFQLLDPSLTNVTPAPSGTINAGTLSMDWPQETVFAVAGVYTLVPTLTGQSGITETVDPVYVAVNPNPSDTPVWVTPAQVLAITRVQVTEADIASAVAIIELIVGKDITDPTCYYPSDVRQIRYAIAFQAAHLTANPTVLTDIAASSKAVGDVSVSYDTATLGATAWLAPLAKIALRKVSWKGSRTLLLGRLADRVPLSQAERFAALNVQFDYVSVPGQGTLNEEDDPEDGWTPLVGS